MLAERAYDIVRQFVAFIDVTAYYAYITLLAFGVRLRLHVALIIVVGHGLYVGDHAGFCNGTDEHAVRVQIYILLYLQRHKGIDVSWQEYQSVVRTERRPAFELIHCPSALETEVLEYLERCVGRQAVNVHDSRLLDHMMGIVILVDGNCDPVRRIGDLCDGIDDQSVVLLAVIGGNNIESVSDLEQCSKIVLIRGLVVLSQIVLAEFVG